MLTFKDYIKTHEGTFEPTDQTRQRLEDMIAILSNLEPDEIEDMKDVLLELQKSLAVMLTGGV